MRRAHEHVDKLKLDFHNVRMERVDLTPTFDTITAALPRTNDDGAVQLSLANTRARLRMTTLFHLAGLHRYLVVGTGNKVEDFGVGFYTKYGDGGVDLSPIADLHKTGIYALGKSMGVVESIMTAKPTDGLFGDDRSDEDQLGATYPELEWAMDLRARLPKPLGVGMDRGIDPATLDLTDRQRTVLAIFDGRHAANRHKMEPIPICHIPSELKD